MFKTFPRSLATWLAAWIGAATSVMGQNPEAGHIRRTPGRAVLIVEAPRPVDSAAITLAQEFGVAVSVEDPVYLFEDDIRDVTAAVSRKQTHRSVCWCRAAAVSRLALR